MSASCFSLRSSLFRFLSGKRESREGTGTARTKKLGAGGRAKFFALATSPRLSLSTALRKRNRLLRRLTLFEMRTCIGPRTEQIVLRTRELSCEYHTELMMYTSKKHLVIDNYFKQASYQRLCHSNGCSVS